MEDELLGRGKRYDAGSDEDNSGDEACCNVRDVDKDSSREWPRETATNVAQGGAKTGPKGVLQDFQRYKQMQHEEDILEQKRKMKFIKDSAITCRSEKEDLEDEKLKEIDDHEDDDEFLREYHEKRLQQLRAESEKYVLGTRSQFTKVHDLTFEDFIEAIDNVDVHVTVIIHIYENSSLCARMNSCLDCLAKQYQYVKFCRISASEARLSAKFKLNAVPTLQVYKNGILIGNHIRMSDHFDNEFYAADVENFLIEHDALPSQEFNAANPVVIPTDMDDFSDSDFELD